MLINIDENCSHLIKDDPVRPELDYIFRTSNEREVFVETENGTPNAVICVGYNHQVPKTIEELDKYSEQDFTDPLSIAVFYTVWSYKLGSGKKIVFDAVKRIKEEKKRVIRFVTLSPKTKMARKFHLNNGAILLSENEVTDNYEYLNM